MGKKLSERVAALESRRALDPDLTANLETDAPNVPAANPTNGPHRVTFVVPVPDETQVSFGAASPQRINDVGITGKTKTHIHWHVHGGTKTVVTLGSGATTAGNVPAYDATIPTAGSGYAMATEGVAWHDSNLKQYMVSRTGDVVVRSVGRNALFKSDAHDLAVEAGATVSIGAKTSVKIVGDSGLGFDNPNYGTNTTAALSQSFDLKAEKIAISVADIVQSTYGVLGSVIKLNGKEPVWKKVEWKSMTNWDVAKVIVDLGKLASSIYRTYASAHATGKVDVNAETYASMSGGIAASLYGRVSASVTSYVSASLLGGTAGVKGLAWTSVWGGLGTSVKAGKDVAVEGEYGKASLKGKKDVEVSSSTAGVKIQGDTDAQLIGKSGTAFVYGKTKFFGAAGAGAGYGAEATSGGFRLGKISSGADKADSVSFDMNNAISIVDGSITLKHNESEINLGNAAKMSKGGGTFLELTSSQAHLNGNKVLLG